MKKSGCTLFPFKEGQEDGLRRAETTNDLVKSCMGLFLVTSPGQRRGNPIGSILPSLKGQLIQEKALSQFADKIKQELSENFPGVFVSRVQLSYSQDNLGNNVAKTLLELVVSFSVSTNNLTTFSIFI